MKYLYIGRDNGYYMIDCERFCLYNSSIIPLLFSSKIEKITSILALIMMFILPLAYIQTSSFVAVGSILIASIILCNASMLFHRKTTCEIFSRMVEEQSAVKIVDKKNATKIIKKICWRKLIICFVSSLLLLFAWIYIIYLMQSGETLKYNLLLLLNAPTIVVLLWVGLQPIKTICFYHKLRHFA